MEALFSCALSIAWRATQVPARSLQVGRYEMASSCDKAIFKGTSNSLIEGPNMILRSFIAIMLAILWLPTTSQADTITVDVDITNADQFGSGLLMRVFGSITLDPDIVDTSAAVFSSSIQYQLDGGAPVDLSLFFNAGGSDLDFVTIGNALFKEAGSTIRSFNGHHRKPISWHLMWAVVR